MTVRLSVVCVYTSVNLAYSSLCIYFIVLYAPYIGRVLGLDMARKCTREMALSECTDISDPVPQYPESVAYYVCEIKKGIILYDV